MTPRQTHLKPVPGPEAAASDATLLALARAGRAEAFGALYRRHHDRALRLARHLCASAEMAEDVTQEAFLDVWRSAHRFDPRRAPFGAWLSSIVRNRAIDAHRRAAARPTVVASLEEGRVPMPETTSPQFWSADRDALLRALAKLPEPQRRAIFLAYYHGLTHVQVAAACRVPVGTVKGRIRLGLERLRCALPDEEPARLAA